jgi:hypothetical protein
VAITWTYYGGQVNTTSGTKSFVIAPSIGDYVVVVVAHTGYTGSAAPTEDGGSTYSLVNTATKASSADKMAVYVRAALITSTADLTITHAPGTTTGGGIFIFGVTEIATAGSTGIVQSATQSNYIDVPDTVHPTMGAAVKNANPVLVCFFNSTNPAPDIHTTSPAYTNQVATGYATPTTGFAAYTIPGGETNTTLASNGNSASEYCSIAIEIDANVYSVAGTTKTGILRKGVS